MMIECIRNVLPGDSVLEKGTKCFGIHDNRAVIAGQLCRIESLYFIRSKTRAYRPTRYDIVIGRVIYTSADYYKADLGGCIGYLPTLSFANATKRNRPELERGDWVICQVVRVVGDPLLCCKQEGLGKVDEVFPVESWKMRLLYFSDFLRRVGATHTFKIGMGMNGYVWLDGDAATKRDILQLIGSIK